MQKTKKTYLNLRGQQIDPVNVAALSDGIYFKTSGGEKTRMFLKGGQWMNPLAQVQDGDEVEEKIYDNHDEVYDYKLVDGEWQSRKKGSQGDWIDISTNVDATTKLNNAYPDAIPVVDGVLNDAISAVKESEVASGPTNEKALNTIVDNSGGEGDGLKLNRDNLKFISPREGNVLSPMGDTNILDLVKAVDSTAKDFKDGYYDSGSKEDYKAYSYKNTTDQDLYIDQEALSKGKKAGDVLKDKEQMTEIEMKRFLEERYKNNPQMFDKVKNFDADLFEETGSLDRRRGLFNRKIDEEDFKEGDYLENKYKDASYIGFSTDEQGKYEKGFDYLTNNEDGSLDQQSFDGNSREYQGSYKHDNNYNFSLEENYDEYKSKGINSNMNLEDNDPFAFTKSVGPLTPIGIKQIPTNNSKSELQGPSNTNDLNTFLSNNNQMSVEEAQKEYQDNLSGVPYAKPVGPRADGRGLKYGGSNLIQKQTGGNNVTTADSLFLYNKVQDLYKNLDSMGATKVEGGTGMKYDSLVAGPQSKWENNFGRTITELKDGIQSEGKLGNDGTVESSEYYDNIDDKFYGTTDWLEGGGDDIDFPITYINQYIKPQSFQDNLIEEVDANGNEYDITQVASFMYDPLVIKPDYLLTDEERKIRNDPDFKPNTDIKRPSLSSRMTNLTPSPALDEPTSYPEAYNKNKNDKEFIKKYPTLDSFIEAAKNYNKTGSNTKPTEEEIKYKKYLEDKKKYDTYLKESAAEDADNTARHLKLTTDPNNPNWTPLDQYLVMTRLVKPVSEPEYVKPPSKVKSKETTEEKTDSSKPIRSSKFSEDMVRNQGTTTIDNDPNKRITRKIPELKYTNLYTPGAAKLFPDYNPSKQTFEEGAADYKTNHLKRGYSPYQTGGSLTKMQIGREFSGYNPLTNKFTPFEFNPELKVNPISLNMFDNQTIPAESTEPMQNFNADMYAMNQSVDRSMDSFNAFTADMNKRIQNPSLQMNQVDTNPLSLSSSNLEISEGTQQMMDKMDYTIAEGDGRVTSDGQMIKSPEQIKREEKIKRELREDQLNKDNKNKGMSFGDKAYSGFNRALDSKAVQKYGKIGAGAVRIAKPLNRLLEQKDERDQYNTIMNNAYLADNMFASGDADISGSKGDYDVSGIFRPGDKVTTRQGKYGVEISNYLTFAKNGGSFYNDGGEAEIDANMYKELIAAGADLEII